MKRILSLALICVILAVSLAPKAAAAESTFVELLDIMSANGFDNNKVWYEQGRGIRSVMNSNSVWHVEYIDILFLVPDGATANSVKVGFTSSTSSATTLTTIRVSGNLYRAYGKVSGETRIFYTWVDVTGGAYVVFESYRVSTSALAGVDENAYCDIQAYEYSNTINFVPSDLINYRTFTGSNDPEMNMLHLYIWCDNWRKYDYLDFVFSVDISAINSINATFGDTNVSFEYSFLDNGGVIQNHFIVSVRLDLRNLDRTSTEGLIVHVYGQVNSGSTNFISMDGCRGFCLPADLDANIAWYRRFFNFFQNDLWFNLRSILESGLSDLGEILSVLSPDSSSGDAFKDESSDRISGLEDISASMDSIQRPSMDSIDADFTGDISDASALMTGLFTEVTSIPWLATILLASCTIGLISYILYGKD